MAKKKPKPKSPFLGRWHIVSMSQWDEDYLNEEVQAFIEFEEGQRGVRSSSATSKASSTTVRASGTASPRSSGPGRATMNRTRRWGGAGPCWRATNSMV